jgi:hypothetical protein
MPALTFPSGLKPGDCGSWVVDPSTRSVYGHVVASDAFGDAYVIPMFAIFQDIRHHLRAKYVGLPLRQEPEIVGQDHETPSQKQHVGSVGNELVGPPRAEMSTYKSALASFGRRWRKLIGRRTKSSTSDHNVKLFKVLDSGYSSVQTSSESSHNEQQGDFSLRS